MIEQGDIITLSFDPARGHEQKGHRPALVVSNNVYNKKTSFRVLARIFHEGEHFAVGR